MRRAGWDYIIVGAGSAGCVLARRLSDDRATRVLLLEAGGRDWSPYLHIPAGRIRLNAKYDWDYPGQPDSTRDNRVENWESGRVLGGTSAINGMNWTRGDASDYDGWAAAGCPGWDYAGVLPYFKRAEHFEGGASEYRGGDGPVHVSFLRTTHPLVDDFLQTAQNYGVHPNPDCNGVDVSGAARGQVSQRRGLRHSTGRAYLATARYRPNLKIVTNAVATRVVIENGRAIGVDYVRGNSAHTARTAGEVIVSSGAIGSPKLLLLSGIGSGSALTALGIDVQQDLPGVGQHLRNHLGMLMLFEVNVPTLNRDFTGWGAVKHGLDLVLRGRGAATSAMGHAQIIASHGGGDLLDYKFIFGPYGRFNQKETGSSRDKHKLTPDKQVSAITLRPSLLHPKTTGALTLRSADPSAPPVIDYHVAAEQDDMRLFVDVCRTARKLVSTEPLKSRLVREITPGPQIDADEDWLAYLRSNIHAGKHTCGTCKMGVDELAVVDPELRVHGIAGLRVVDASIMPDITTGGTNAPTVMIAEKAADLIKAARTKGN
jgi:choline dehydrogenase